MSARRVIWAVLALLAASEVSAAKMPWAPCPGISGEAVTVGVFFTCPEASWSKLFPSGGLVRVVPCEPGPLNGAIARTVLASVSGFAANKFTWHGQFDCFGSTLTPICFLTTEGSGLAFLPRAVRGGARVALCPIYRNAIVGRAQVVGVTGDDFILLKVLLGNQPYVCAMRVFTPRTKEEMAALVDHVHGEGKSGAAMGAGGLMIELSVRDASPEVRETLCGAR